MRTHASFRHQPPASILGSLDLPLKHHLHRQTLDLWLWDALGKKTKISHTFPGELFWAAACFVQVLACFWARRWTAIGRFTPPEMVEFWCKRGLMHMMRDDVETSR